ncbi:MAG TPA: arylsulfatase, partial [Planctomycetota bacterium]|nr:arylsulfatase [Planctomycetota bacterium]
GTAPLALASRPNVVVVITDDQGYGDFGATGNGAIETPHIDALARRSASMATFYVSPVCSPTRASLMTGRYNYRTRVIDTYLGRSMMAPEEVTIAEVLRDAGYATGIFGKWHLGDNYPMRPQDQGFEEALVLRGGGLAQPSEPPENERRYTDPVLFRNGERVETKGYCTDVYFDHALDFIKRGAEASRPFFAYVATNAPHDPLHDVPKDLLERYLEDERKKKLAELVVGGEANAQRIDRLARIAAMITNIDANVGRLMATLDELGIAEDTLVVFLCDNGPAGARYVGPFRGQKTQVHEGGVRSPLWLHWPRRLEAGLTRHQPVAHIDLFPTILEACGVAAPSGLRLDGRSFLGLLTGERETWPSRTLVLQTHRGDEPVRYHHFMIRDDRYKLLHASGFGRERFDGEPRFELYDLGEDPGETRDLAKDRPEIVARLKSSYDAWFDDVSTTRP